MSSYWNHERTWLRHTPYSRLVGAVLGDSDVSTSAAWSILGESGWSTSPLQGLYTSM